MSRRIVVEETCKHGNVSAHVIGRGIGKTYTAEDCPGGSRREISMDYDAAASQLGQIPLLAQFPTDWLRAEARAIVETTLFGGSGDTGGTQTAGGPIGR